MNTEFINPNYSDCITNLANSIMKYFGIATYHNGIVDVNKILEEKKPKNVVVILYDGMGKNILERALSKNDFLIKKMIRGISSVAPSTTTAATTSMLSGMNPAEHGWLGWDLYFKDIDKIVTMFLNTLKDTDVKVAEENIAEKYFAYKSIIDKINESDEYYSKKIMPFGDEKYIDIDDMMKKILNEINKDDRKKYIYAYYEDPDTTMHKKGTDSIEAINMIKMINKKTEELCNEINDAIIIVIADHGHKNSKGILLSEYKDFYDLLASNVWIECRFCTFKVKMGCEKKFKELFKKYFEKDFILKTKEEIINEKILGEGVENKYLRDSIGDFVALAISDKYFRYGDNSTNFISMHAGFTEDEMIIPLIIIEK